MAMFNIYTTYYENFLVLSVSIRVNGIQLELETPVSSQAPVLRYRDIEVNTKKLKESLSAVCPLLGVHDVARVRQGGLFLVEVDFTDENRFQNFCKSLSSGGVHERLQGVLQQGVYSSKQKLEVTLKLHLIMPNAEKKNPVSREVTTDNYRDCFSLIRESALFEFKAFHIAHGVFTEEAIQQVLAFGADDFHELLEQLMDVSAYWYTVGIFLKIAHPRLDAIGKDYHKCNDCLTEMLATWLKGTDAFPAALVRALRSAGMIVLAQKLAVKYDTFLIAATGYSRNRPPELVNQYMRDFLEQPIIIYSRC